MNRRTFLKIAGMGSLSFASGCTLEPEKFLYSLVHAPEDMVTGMPAWFASTCRECPAGCGILAKNREGRVIKVEGNPLHPINKGTLCMRGQAAVQDIYHPDRLHSPRIREGDRWRSISFARAEQILAQRTAEAAAAGPDRVHLITGLPGDSLANLFTEALDRWNSDRRLVFEPFAYESLKSANAQVFGIRGLFAYQMDEADLLISFGADFLETWLSPVEYARRFKQMHAYRGNGKGAFVHISPCQSLTGANADRWIRCRPGSEASIALGLIREVLAHEPRMHLGRTMQENMTRVVSSYTLERVAELAGVDLEELRALSVRLLRARRPLILGTGTGGSGDNGLQSNIAANLLNVLLDPELNLLRLGDRQAVEAAADRAEVLQSVRELEKDGPQVLLIHRANPVFSLPAGSGLRRAMNRKDLFTVCFSDFEEDTSRLADLILPVRLPLEGWGDYTPRTGLTSLLQPAMGRLTEASHLGDVLLRTAFDAKTAGFQDYVYTRLKKQGLVDDPVAWTRAVGDGGIFEAGTGQKPSWYLSHTVMDTFYSLAEPATAELSFTAAPSIRFFDGRGANKPWLPEIPDPLTKVAWQSPIVAHPRTLAARGLAQGDVVKVRSKTGSLEAPVFAWESVADNVLVMGIGQGHGGYGRYAASVGANPYGLLPLEPDPRTGGARFFIGPVTVHPTGRRAALAHTDGSRSQHGRKIALAVPLEAVDRKPDEAGKGLAMFEFPLALPLPEGYAHNRDIYPAHDHAGYRWSMVVDLDRCIGCAACAAACYAENNIGIVGEEQIVNGREQSWMRIERYLDPDRPDRVHFLPMLCQHCDDAPCESVCPVFAPHHNKEGINNQIYNRCIGTRFCAQNCPYKVRRFNWFTWQWPEPLNLQLNPDVTVRSKGVMEKCSFCIQRIKFVHGVAKNENRAIRDGEVVPACVQTCPTGALTFGNLMDPESRVRQLVRSPRIYQVMGYLNTKPAVFYLKKVVQAV